MDANHQTTDLDIVGMTCASCVGRVEKALAGTQGVTLAQVNLATERASIQHAATVSVEQLVQVVARAGYEARIADEGPAEPSPASASPFAVPSQRRQRGVNQTARVSSW